MSEQYSTAGTAPRAIRGTDLAGLFLLSFSLITLEILQTKVFSYSLTTLLLYCVIGLALIGIGAGATFVSILPPLPLARRRTLAFASALGFAISIVPVHYLFCRIVPDLSIAFSGMLVLLAALLALPYILTGITIALLLSMSNTRIHTAYGANLLGSGAGCFTVFLFLRPLGGEAFVFLVAVLASLAALVLAWPRGWGSRSAAAAVGIVAAVSLGWAPSILPFPPERYGQLELVEQLAAKVGVESKIEFDEWDPTGRIQVHSYHDIPGWAEEREYPYRFYSQDASAGSFLVRRKDRDPGIEKLFQNTLYRQAYYRDLRPEVLVIGLGGGPDIATALYHDARSIVGVEINGAACRMGLGAMDGFLGGTYTDARVEIANLDGRSYAAATARRFDIVQMSGTDTKHLLAAGSLAINECYLYTVEAFLQYFDRLKPNGVISLIRFGPSDALRLASIGVATLRELGVQNPERNFVILHAHQLCGVLIKREAFTAAELDRLAEIYPDCEPGIVGPQIVFLDAFHLSVAPTPGMDYLPGRVSKPPFQAFFAAVADGHLDRWIAAADQDYSPTTDARPFYFDRTRYFRTGVRLPPHMTFIGYTLLILVALALVLILAPLGVYRLRDLATPSIGRNLVYFSSIGVAYMLIEIGLIHHFSIFLGHQTYSFTVVIFGLLTASGLGSLASGRLIAGRSWNAWGILVGVSMVVVLFEMLLPRFLGGLVGAPFTVRVLLAFGLLSIPGFLMGMPFPTGLHAIRLRAPNVIPWAIGINGAFSVIATTSSIPLALIGGFPVLMGIGALLYLVAALAFRFPRTT
ncbi:MAG: hypothetical protein JXQ29_06535 [Planctomycetes bacterium]|nr:hypothetical protein [Planctomycetota bacterium]